MGPSEPFATTGPAWVPKRLADTSLGTKGAPKGLMVNLPEEWRGWRRVYDPSDRVHLVPEVVVHHITSKGTVDYFFREP